jgi:tungstate transport system substrate-binding protein
MHNRDQGQMMPLKMFLGLLIAVTSACSPKPSPPANLDIATTTSVVNSGLLESLLPAFKRDTSVTVRVHAAGSGRALEMLNDGVVDLVISHAPKAEQRMLEMHADWQCRKIAANHFLIAGPAADPAGVKGASSAIAAFERIVSQRAYFVSRGDGSGTHEREMDLWSSAGIKPEPDRLLISGSGMGATLRQADERNAYTLTDDATFAQLRDRLQLQTLFSGDPDLVNGYAVVHPTGSKLAARFAEWLVRGEGRQQIASYTTGGSRPFQVWPEHCPGEKPTAPLCDER